MAAAAAASRREGGAAAARAILTTDTQPKEVALDFPLRRARGAPGRHGQGRRHDRARHGHPARLLHHRRPGGCRALLQRALREAVGESLNRITVDGDTSTNDMAVILASGAAAHRPSCRRGPTSTPSAAALAEAARAPGGDDRPRRRGRHPRGRGSRRGRAHARPTPTASPAPWPSRPWSRPPSTAATRTGAASSPPRGARGWTWTSTGLDIFIGDVWVAEGGAARAYDEALAAAAMREDPVRLASAASRRARPRACGLDLRPDPRLRGHQRALSNMKLWGGNYGGDPDRRFWEFNRSFGFDQRLLREEIAASRAYARALGRCGALPPAEAQAPRRRPRRKSCAGPRPTRPTSTSTSRTCTASWRRGSARSSGTLAGQGHLGRSRNEQAVTALRLWVRAAIDRLRSGLSRLVAALADKGEEGAEAVMPGFTHTRAAEPITFGHLAAAHAWGLVRDFDRLRDARPRVDVLPLGSGALAGTALAPGPRGPGLGPRVRRRLRRTPSTRSWIATSPPSSPSPAPSSRPISRGSARTSSTSRGPSTASWPCPRPSPAAPA